MALHRPRSTGDAVRTIQRRNMHTRLQLDVVSLGMTPVEPCSTNHLVIYLIASMAGILVSPSGMQLTR